MQRRLIRLTLAVLGGCAALGCRQEGPRQPQAAALPIYRLSAAEVGADSVQRVATATLGVSGKVVQDRERLTLRSGTKLVQAYIATGGFWVADEAQLWNADMSPSLPDSQQVKTISDEFFRKTNLLPSPTKDQPFAVSFAGLGGTRAAFFDPAARKRTDRQLDVQATYSIRMAIPRRDSVLRFPIVGGGGEFNLTLGNKGAVIGYSGVWRPIVGLETESPLIPKEKADAQFRELVKALRIRSFESFLAYYSAPASVEQKFLFPVYVYRAVAVVGSQTVPLRLITLPATEWGPRRERPAPVPTRTEQDRPTRRSTMPEDPWEERETKPERAPGGMLMIQPPLLASRAAVQGSWREAGTSWIGQSGGLAGSRNNAKGFVDGLSADGWTVNFNWGDGAAWESDWRRNDDSWVDAADFVFYTGHANMNGWVLSPPDDGSLDFSEVGAAPATPGDLWGQQDLEWVIIAACGPLQDNVISANGGDVFDRWDGAFDRLHQLLGYGAITFDNEDEGKSVVRYATDGETLINAWFRAAREIQPGTNGASAPDGPSVWVGVMYVTRSGTTSPADDHIWLHGSIAPDPASPNGYVAMWTTT
jgi:hypothetical protein